MAEATEDKSESAADRAYAAAAEAIPVKSDPVKSGKPLSGQVPATAAAVELVKPAKAEPAKVDAVAVAKPVAAAPAPVAPLSQDAAAPVEFPGKASRAAKVQPTAPEAAAPVAAKPAAGVKPTVAAKPVVTPKPVVAAKAPARKVSKPKTPAPVVQAPDKPVSRTSPANPPQTSISQLKDKIMATKKTTDFTEGFQNVVADAQAKAQEVFEKSSTAFGEANEFAKGNVEAIVESGKVLQAALQEMGTAYVAEAKAAFETMSADVKEFASAKTPADVFKLQSELVRRNFDSAVALSSKNSEAMLKLATDVFAPISSRVSVAVQKIRTAA
ncbi:MAG: phasin family protein [Novosphingobium sp.]